jgi:hypothetical protein
MVMVVVDSHIGRLLRTAYRFEGEEQEQEEAHEWVSGLACWSGFVFSSLGSASKFWEVQQLRG